jgi:hypothetical protein
MASAVLCLQQTGQTLIPIGHSSRKYGAERELPQVRLELTSPAFTHEGEIPARISSTGYWKMLFGNDKKDNNPLAQVVPLLPSIWRDRAKKPATCGQHLFAAVDFPIP